MKYLWIMMCLPVAAIAESTGGLRNLTQLTHDQNSIAPVFSPTDGNLIAVTTEKYQEIKLLRMSRTLSAGEPPKVAAEETLPTGEHSGFGFSWTGNGQHIVYRHQEEGAEQAGAIDVRTKEVTELSEKTTQVSVPTTSARGIFFSQGAQGARLPPPGMRVSMSDQPVIVENNGQITVSGKLINPEQQTCWLPRLSADSQKVSFECWDGIHVYDINNEKRYFLDAGTSPAWAADSEHLVYEQTEDDGHKVVRSDVFFIKYTGENKLALSADLQEIVRRPSLSPDQRKIAIDIEGDVYLADVVLPE